MVLVSRWEPSGKVHPIGGAGEGRLAVGSGFIVVEGGGRTGSSDSGMASWWSSPLGWVPDDGERFAPVALAAEEPVAEFVIVRGAFAELVGRARR
jgi:hypothetical protein